MLLPLQGDRFVSVITQGVALGARSFCPLPLLYPSASDFQFPSAGDRWFRACCFWSFWAFSPYLNHLRKFSKLKRGRYLIQ